MIPLKSRIRSVLAIWQHLLFRTIVFVSLLAFALLFVNGPYFNKNDVENGVKSSERKKADERVADYTWWLNVFTALLGGVAAVQVVFLKRTDRTATLSANAAITAASVARDTLVASHRAWIEPSIEEGTGTLIVRASGAAYSIKVRFKNIGNVPATNIRFEGWLVARKMVDYRGLRQVSPIILHRAKCIISRDKQYSQGHMLFPGEAFPQAQGYSDFELNCSMSGTEVLDGSFNFGEKEVRVIVLYVGGAINYEFGSDNKTHQSSFLYEITLKLVSVAFPVDELRVYAADEIRLYGIPEGDGRQAD